jgi:zinc D-Ala-D-Ala dipeptidase
MKPEGFVDLAELEGVRLEIGYHREDNFTGRRVPGYEGPGAWLIEAAARSLEHVLTDLARERLGLVVYDAYRPRRAALAMADHCERHAPYLLDGYIARESRHSRGIAIDAGLVHLDSGAILPMGTAWDTFHEGSWYPNATGAARVHRRLLRETMTRHGFAPYDREWWHFELRIDPTPPMLDVPYEP